MIGVQLPKSWKLDGVPISTPRHDDRSSSSPSVVAFKTMTLGTCSTVDGQTGFSECSPATPGSRQT
jgi:hypothetical protein